MDRRRYDDVLRFIAAILFGTSFRELGHVVDELKRLGCSDYSAMFTAIAFYAVYFRNVHGLIAYDIWVETSRYEPRFEQTSFKVSANFFFALGSVVLLPYVFIYERTVTPSDDSPEHFALFLFLPITSYVVWDYFWFSVLKKLPLINPEVERERKHRWQSTGEGRFPKSVIARCRKFGAEVLWTIDSLLKACPVWGTIEPPEQANRIPYRAYAKLFDFSARWLWLQLAMCALLGGILAYPALMCVLERMNDLLSPFARGPNLSVANRASLSIPTICIIYAWSVTVYLILDYASHTGFYFPTPLHPSYRRSTDTTMSFYEFRGPWAYILPDGPAFCHWGGKKLSKRLVDMLAVCEGDLILEVCCGQGGTLGLLPRARARRIVGIDISQRSLLAAAQDLNRDDIELLCADARTLDFPSGTFTKIFAQDGDAWLHPSKSALMSEIHRVAAEDCLFLYQSYVCSASMPADEKQEMEAALRSCGWIYVDVPRLEEIPRMFQMAGFQIEKTIPLHREYESDNHAMLSLLRSNLVEMRKSTEEREVRALLELLELEQRLFAEGSWTGILVVARKM